MGRQVLCTRNLPAPALELLEKECAVRVFSADRPMSRAELLEQIRDKHAVLCMLNDRIDQAVIDAAPDLTVIANLAVGFDNIDLQAATRRGIVVTNTPDVLTEATADLAWALLMAVARRVVEADQYVRRGAFSGWGPMLLVGQDLHGKTLGIIGLGRIGRAVARRARGFAMRILYNKRNPLSPVEEEDLGLEYASFGEIIEESDFISLHLPLTPQSRHLIGRQELRRMKKEAILINTARGPIVDEQALVEALRDGQIKGAGLDVFEDEPQLAAGLSELSNVVVVPHIGSATVQTREKMALMAARSIIDVLNGRRPENVVNKRVFER